jgi:6-phosphogluconolactonase (cycloisomerase 2 family)
LSWGWGGWSTYSVDSDGVDRDTELDFSPPHIAYGIWSDGNFIYAAGLWPGTAGKGIHTLSIDGNGKKTHISMVSLPSNSGAQYGGLDMWGDGNFIYHANYANGLHVYSVDDSGTLTHIDFDRPSTPCNGQGHANAVWGDGNFIYLAEGYCGLHVYSVDGSGNLTRVSGTGYVGATHFFSDVWGDGNFIYSTHYREGLHVYSVDSSGNLTHIDSHNPNPTPTGENSFGRGCTAVWGDGNFIYVSNFGNGLHVYSVDGSGNLTHIDSDDPSTSPQDKGYDVMGDGNFIYLANGTGGIHTYSVDGSGNLTHVNSDDRDGPNQGGIVFGYANSIWAGTINIT